MNALTSRHVISALAVACFVGMSSSALAQAKFSCPVKGGEFIFALEAKVPTYDQHVSTSAQSRNVASLMFESLITRDEKMQPTLMLAESVNESPDGLTYTFKIRQGVPFHNGKIMTSEDVVASYERYRRVGVDKSMFGVIDSFAAPDPSTFVIKMKQPQAIFLESFSNIAPPVVIIPKESASAEQMQLPAIGTGPFQFVEFVADSHFKAKRFDGYKPNDSQTGTNGLGGYKVACVDTVNFRMIVEPQARVAALETGEVHGVEDVPRPSQKRLANNANIKFQSMENFWVHLSYPNLSFPPTDNLKFRQAVQAALDMDEIMEASSDGLHRMDHALQFPTSPYYSQAGKEHYNQKNKDKAKKLLQEAGYKGEKVVLLTNKDYVAMYNASLVMAEQMKTVGINAELLIHDWPAALAKSVQETTGWNYFYTGWTTVVGQTGLPSLRNLTNPNNVHKPKNNQSDAQLMEFWNAGLNSKNLQDRVQYFAKAQQRIYDEALALTFGVMPKVAATRANVEGFQNFFLPRAWNVSIKK
ncbi:MAG: ABC transporter substrate-binding protein [Alphaproteobacteria bacterium]|nr:ABC transporter substrate-binding protein [Alphaproteobacteria bacterium]